MLRIAIWCAALALICSTGFSPASAEKRVALVIGIDKYAEVAPLKKAVGDAQALSAALAKLGFAVTLITDADRRTLNRSLADFERSLSAGDIALVHYSGHGVEIDGENYLLPADIPRPTSGNRNYVKDEALGLTAIVERLKQTGAATRLLIIDACRDNPFAQAGVRSVGGIRGLARVEAPQGTFIMYSAGYGQTALDRLSDEDAEPTSVFTRVLLKHLAVKGQDITDIAKDVRSEVAALASNIGHDQFPAYYDELAGRFMLQPGDTAPSVVSPGDPIAAEYQAAERMNTPEAWEAFVAAHGTLTGNFYVELAKAKRQKLALNVPPPAPTPPANSACDGVLLASSGGPSKCLKPGDEFTECDECPKMVVIPPGKFMMGSPTSEKDRKVNEGPQHAVKIGGPFAVGKLEVSRREFAAFASEGGYNETKGRLGSCWVYDSVKHESSVRYDASFRNPGFIQTDKDPVVCVSWHDAQDYVRWLSRKTGAEYRLLSEAEWEYAARAGSSGQYSFGDQKYGPCDAGNIADRTAKTEQFPWAKLRFLPCSDGIVFTSPGGKFSANAFGLHDMQGNVSELVQDVYNDSYRAAPSDGSAWVSGENSTYRVKRGASFLHHLAELRLAFRTSVESTTRTFLVGFRVARTLTPLPRL